MDRNDIPRAGLITTRNWLVGSDGDQHRAFWSPSWLIVTDKEAGLAGIKSQDKWSAVAYGPGGEILMIIPGCEVVGYMVCKEPTAGAICKVQI